MDNIIKDIINNAAAQTGRTAEEVEEVYTSVFGFIKGRVDAIDFSTITTENDFRSAKTNFNIPRILKLYTTPERVEYVKNKTRKIAALNEQGLNADDNTEGREGSGEWADSSRGSGTE